MHSRRRALDHRLQRGPLDKATGAYYTETRVARALCRWALRQPGERIMDPAFGGGVFLAAAEERLQELGGEAHGGEVHGVELDAAAFAAASARHRDQGQPWRLVGQDFFSLAPSAMPPFDAVVGNPPFIRFQCFTGEARARAARCCREAGIELEPLAGSWVAFVAHASAFLAPSGRLAMIVPAELGHAPYARPLLALLLSSFSRCTIISFRSSLFPHLDQRTVLVLADGHLRGPGEFRALELAGPEALEHPLPCAGDRPLDAETLTAGRSSLAHAHLDPAALSLYRRLGEGPALRLGAVARVESGYVTGANTHFHLGREEASRSGLPKEVLIPAVFRSRALGGLSLTRVDWAATDDEQAGFLVQAYGHELHAAVASFLRRLEEEGIHLRYKTRNRAVWHRVPRVNVAPLLLSAMGGHGLRMIVNEAGVVAPNTFHLVTPDGDSHAYRHVDRQVSGEFAGELQGWATARITGDVTSAPDSAAGSRIGSEVPGQETSAYYRSLAAAWLTSLTRLSVELEGHALGGGLLKCDPGEARQVLLPPPSPLSQACLERLDRLLRSGQIEAARHEADQLLLGGVLGLSDNEIALLASAAAELAARRRSRP